MSIQCKVCGKKAIDGYAIHRTSPKGQDFEGVCKDHLPEGQEPDFIANLIEQDNRNRGTLPVS